MILSATGHRPDKLGGYSREVFGKLVRLAELGIAKNAPTKIISGMALGWDQAIAQASINRGIPFTAAVPFPGQEMRWPDFSRTEYARILKCATEVVFIAQTYSPFAMQKQNEWMVDNSNHVLALWNGTPSGTANCLSYARKIGRTYDNFWPIWELP